MWRNFASGKGDRPIHVKKEVFVVHSLVTLTYERLDRWMNPHERFIFCSFVLVYRRKGG